MTGTNLKELILLITPTQFGDQRGFFSETYSRQKYVEMGVDVEFLQDNHSLSRDVGTLRGLHFQAPPHAQAKLVGCLRGRFLDAVVDARRGSPTYGQHLAIELSFENGLQLFVPAGFLHGFVTREPDTVIFYKVDNHYSATADGAVRWDSCGIDWGLDAGPVLSGKDSVAPAFADFDSPFTWEAA